MLRCCSIIQHHSTRTNAEAVERLGFAHSFCILEVRYLISCSVVDFRVALKHCWTASRELRSIYRGYVRRRRSRSSLFCSSRENCPKRYSTISQLTDAFLVSCRVNLPYHVFLELIEAPSRGERLSLRKVHFQGFVNRPCECHPSSHRPFWYGLGMSL